MGRSFHILLVIVGLLSGSLRAADDAAVVFDSLYGRRLQKVGETPATADDVQLAEDLVKAAGDATAQPALLEILCDHAYILAAKDPAGLVTAIAAMTQLAAHVDSRHADALEKIAALQQRRLSTARPADKPAIAAALAQTLVELAQMQRDGGDLPAALKLYQKATVAIGSLDPALRQRIAAETEEISRRQKLLDAQRALEAELKADPANTEAAKKLTRLLVVERDDPAGALSAAKSAADPVLLHQVTCAAADPATLTVDQLASLGDWYRDWFEGADAAARPAMFDRARRYYRAFLDADGPADLAKKKAELALAELDTALARLSAGSAAPAAPAPRTVKPPPVPRDVAARLKVAGTGFVVAPLDAGSKAYENRGYTWISVPAAFRGYRYTRMRGGAKDVTVSVTLETAGRVYIMTGKPDPVIRQGWKKLEGVQTQYSDPGKSVVHVLYRDAPAGAKLAIPQSDWTGTMLLLPPEK